jgi:hypothetical protein
MHWSDFLIGVKLIIISLALGFFSGLIYPWILDHMGRRSICLITPHIAVLTSALLLGLGVLIFILSFMLEEEE